MFETEAELDALQSLLDRSYATAGPHLRVIVEPERRLTARQVAHASRIVATKSALEKLQEALG